MSGFFDFLRQNWPELLVLTREHIYVVFLATGLAIVIGLPLGILLTRVKSLQTPVLGFANIMQTVPSLALFGLLIPTAFHRRHRRADGDHRTFALRFAAGDSKYGNGNPRHRSKDPRGRDRDGDDRRPDPENGRAAAGGAGDPYGHSGRSCDLASASRRLRPRSVPAGLELISFAGLRQNDNNLLLAGALAAAFLALLCDFAIGQVEKSYKIGEPPSKERKVLDRRNCRDFYWRLLA